MMHRFVIVGIFCCDFWVVLFGNPILAEFYGDICVCFTCFYSSATNKSRLIPHIRCVWSILPFWVISEKRRNPWWLWTYNCHDLKTRCCPSRKAGQMLQQQQQQIAARRLAFAWDCSPADLASKKKIKKSWDRTNNFLDRMGHDFFSWDPRYLSGPRKTPKKCSFCPPPGG